MAAILRALRLESQICCPAGRCQMPTPALFAACFRPKTAGRFGLQVLMLFLLSAAAPAQTVEEFPIPSGAEAFQIASGPDQAMWFTEPSAARIGRINQRGDVTEFSLPTGSSDPEAITLGPDGAMWFTERGKIGRITRDGRISEFPVPWPAPRSIVTGSDGALWFTIWYVFAVGRMTTAGVVSDYPT